MGRTQIIDRFEISCYLKRSGIHVTRLTHDKDASTFKNVLEVFEDVAEQLCTSKLHDLHSV
jgi:hypothetical protein